ncbi:hypothetical protein HRW19_25310, partial [Streptomyces lunaelactis]|nr:hypothetical protein [Streptomyces lunaelactis]
MRKLPARHALLAALATVTLFTSGCSAETGATSPAAAGADGQRPSSIVTPDPGPSRQLPVTGVPDGEPTGVARAGSDGKATKSPLKVASYDRSTRRAVISSTG